MFNDEGLAVMLEKADKKKLDMIYPVKGALLGHVCGKQETFPVTRAYKEYVDIMEIVFVYKKRKKWTKTVMSSYISIFNNSKKMA